MSAAFFLQFFPSIFGFFIGACLGSFSSALIWRLPRKIPWVYELHKGKKEFVRSQCPSCKRALDSKDLIPIFSWLLQAGRCRTCQNKIGLIYPLLEIVWGGIGAIIFYIFGLTFTAAIVLFLVLFSFIYLWVGLIHKFWARDVLIILFFLVLLFIVFTGF